MLLTRLRLVLPMHLLRNFFFNDTATTEIYTLSLHDALPISLPRGLRFLRAARRLGQRAAGSREVRSEEHTSELQSLRHLVCRLLLEKKKTEYIIQGNSSISEASISTEGMYSNRSVYHGKHS